MSTSISRPCPSPLPDPSLCFQTGTSVEDREPAWKVAILGNHLPRRCGIATFTSDLRMALRAHLPNVDCFVVAMNEPGSYHVYPKHVRLEIAERDLASYRAAAEFLNASAVDVVSLQHEYGIFGGDAGSHVLTLLRKLRMPIITTLHTILADPAPAQRRTLDELAALSERVVVMSGHGAKLLHEVHGVPTGKIDVIPHGIPQLGATRPVAGKLGVQSQAVILTFGLLSPDKGIENVIEALPEILAACPQTVYIVLGATHPQVKAIHGEGYRRGLEDLARAIGVRSNVIFHDRFVSQAELLEFLRAADVYVTPYLNLEQITSGTLAYALGNGKAVVSTPYRYARELCAEGRGILVPQRDPGAIAHEIVGLFGDEDGRLALCKRAADYGCHMAWPVVAREYARSFERARQEHVGRSCRTQAQASLPVIRVADRAGAQTRQ